MRTTCAKTMSPLGENAFFKNQSGKVGMHVHLFRYFNGRPGAAELRRRLNTVRTLGEIEDAVRGVLPELV